MAGVGDIVAMAIEGVEAVAKLVADAEEAYKAGNEAKALELLDQASAIGGPLFAGLPTQLDAIRKGDVQAEIDRDYPAGVDEATKP